MRPVLLTLKQGRKAANDKDGSWLSSSLTFTKKDWQLIFKYAGSITLIGSVPYFSIYYLIMAVVFLLISHLLGEVE